MSIDVYAEVTSKIVTMLEAGVVPWRSPILGGAKGGWPSNLHSKKEYRGVNAFLLAFTAWAKGYESSHWITFAQAKTMNGTVRKGEKASLVIFWKTYQTKDSRTGESITVPVLRHYNVFNVEQCDGIAAPDAPPVASAEFRQIDSAKAIADEYVGGPRVSHHGGRAYYTPSSDAVSIPEPERFTSPEDYYSTLFHELAHSTGHSSRLDRGLDTKLAPFGSPDYGREELVAEMAAAYLCGHAGIIPVSVENHAAYLQGWIKTLKGDKRLAIAAAGAAQKAADWVLGNRGRENSGQEKSEAP